MAQSSITPNQLNQERARENDYIDHSIGPIPKTPRSSGKAGEKVFLRLGIVKVFSQ